MIGRAAPRLGVRAGLIAALIAIGCRRDPPPPPPIVEPSGCSAVLRGPICEIEGARTIRLRVRAAAGAALAVTIDAGSPISVALPSPAGTTADDGVLVPVALPETARAVIVTASIAGASSVYRLAITRRPPSPAIAEARSLRAAGKPAEAAARLGDALAGTDTFARHQATRALARVERDLGRGDDAVRRFREAIALDHESGRTSDEVDDRLALAYALVYDGRRFEEARALFPPIDALAADYPDGRARAPYFLGLIAYETGDLRAALRLFRASAEASARFGLENERLDALVALAEALAILGRSAEAADRLREAHAALPADAPPCRRAQLLDNTGWTALRAPLAGLPDPVEPLQQAVELYRGPCKAPRARSNALTNLALAELDRGRAEAARAALAEARAGDPGAGPRIQVVWRAIEARLSLAAEPEVALRLYEEVEALGEGSLLPEARLEGALGRAIALDKLGRVDAARGAYDEADRRIDAWSRLVPLGEGRDTFLARHERSARERVDFLIRTALAAEAAGAARRSRARALTALAWMDRPGALAADRRGPWEQALVAYRRARAALDARAAGDAWLPADRQAAASELRRAEQTALRTALDQALAELGPAPATTALAPAAPDEGELVLVYHPVREGWACFAVTSEKTEAHRLGPIDPRGAKAELAARLLGPVKDALARAQRVRIAAYGELDRIDFHALPWDGRPLLDRLPIVYGLDLPAATPAPTIPGAPLALIVADPLDDLPAARREAGEVAAALEKAGWRVTRIEGRAATHAAVTAALEAPGVALLHYAGHAIVEGRDGWETGLPLASGGRLTVGDVIALARVPARVVLSGCDTARAQDTARAEGLGLAQAFALAGARAIVASTRPVDDRLARSVMASLYPALLAQAGALDLAAALRDAERAIAAGPAPADGSAFRAIVR